MIALSSPALAIFVVSGPIPYATRGVAYSGQAVAGGATAPYTFAITSGALPPGLQMDSTGLVSGTPTHAGNYSYTITATDSTNLSSSANGSIQVAGTPLVISPASLVQGHVGVPYTPVTFAVSGGVPPYTLSVTSTIPPGMTFNPNTGVLSGTPTTGGGYFVDFLVTDQAGDVTVSSLLLPVPDVQPLTTEWEGSVGTAFGMGFSGIGFGTFTTISILSGNLPPGVLFSPVSNAITGTPTQAGTFTFAVRATSGSLFADRTYIVHILSSPPISIAQVIPFGTVGVPYSQTIPVFYVTPPVTFTVTGGRMPPELTVSPSGVVSGTPTHSGQYYVSLSVRDSTGKTGTGDVSVSFVPPPLDVSPNTIPDGAVGQDYSATFTGLGGIPPYRYNLALQVVPGLTLDSVTGVLSGKPTSGGIYNIRIDASDASLTTGSRTYTLNIVGPTPPFTLSPLTFPNGTKGKSYFSDVTASGSSLPPVHFALSGGSPPPGLVLTEIPNGMTINSIPTTAGTYTFQLTATDTGNRSVSQSYTVSIASQAITVGPSSLSAGIASVPYSVTFTATGGKPPYTYSMTGSAGGLQFSPDGVLQGIPAGGNWSFTVKATDSTGATGSWDYSLVFVPATVIVSPLTLPAGMLGKPYSVPMSGNQGVAPYTFSLSSGPLPNGVTLTSSGILAGTPQQAGLFNINITARDAIGAGGSRGYQLLIDGANITLGPNSLPDAFVDKPYLAHLTASGGTPPYTFTRPSANAWVAGLQVASDGTISGSPTLAGASLLDFNIVVTDANGSTGTREFFINLRDGTLSLAPTVLPPGAALANYSAAITASGGSAPYTFSIAPGYGLPAGLSLSTSGIISGTPKSAGNYPFIVQAKDSNSAVGSQAYLLYVAGPAIISLSPGILPSATVGKTYSSVVSASGGRAPYTFSLAPGSVLPAGLSLSGNTLSGTPTKSGSYPFTLQVQDVDWATGSRNYTLDVTTPSAPCSYSISPGGKVFAAAGGTGTIAVTTDTDCSWTITNIPSWVTFTTPTAGTGSGTATFHLGLNNGAGLSAVLSVAGFSFTIEQQTSSIAGMNFVGSMPHTASAENWTTMLTLVNKGGSTAQTRLSLFGDTLDPSGSGPLVLPLVFPQQAHAALPQNATSSPLLAASFDRTLDSNASLIVSTAAPQTPPVLVGSAQLAATGSVDGFAIFHHIVSLQEAVVPLETRNASSYLLAFDNTNGLVLGIAVGNASAQTANIPVVIRDDTGALIGSPGATISLEGNGHYAFDLSAQFPVTANKRGTIEFDTPPGRQISVLGLRFTPPNNALTTIPALANVGTDGGSIAHLASGGDGWQTTFVLVNTGASAAQATLSFFADQTGNPLALPLSFPQSGTGTATVTSSVSQTLAAGATLLVQSSGAPDLLTGSAQLSTTGLVTGFVIFRHNDQEAVVPLETRNASAYVLAFDNTIGTATGVAVNAVSTQPLNIPVVIRDDAGTQIASGTISLAVNGHSAFTLGVDRFPETAGIRGTIEFGTPPGAKIGALGIRIPNVPAHTYTTLPALAK